MEDELKVMHPIDISHWHGFCPYCDSWLSFGEYPPRRKEMKECPDCKKVFEVGDIL